MNKFVGVAIGLAIASAGVAQIIKSRKEQKAADRKATAKKVFRNKLHYSAAIMEEMRLERMFQEAGHSPS